MTLSPVFQSSKAARLLKREEVWNGFAPALDRQRVAAAKINGDLGSVIEPEFVRATDVADAGATTDDLTLLQDDFFLILFGSVLENLGLPERHLKFYAALNYCIKGTITAADNIFDDQSKTFIPLRTGDGTRFLGILQLLCVERLVHRVCHQAVADGLLDSEQSDVILRRLLTQMAHIGRLEGSEEGGVSSVPVPDAMIKTVHEVRGGALFRLAFVAPLTIEPAAMGESLTEAGAAIRQLGTAFQIVDDITDFEVDLRRRTNNLLHAQIRHCGTADEQTRLQTLIAGDDGRPVDVAVDFPSSATAVLTLARDRVRSALERLTQLGFWFPAGLADDVVEAIVGIDGVDRMQQLAAEPASTSG